MAVFGTIKFIGKSEHEKIIRLFTGEIRKKLCSGCDCRWGYQERLKNLWDTVGHIWACFYTHRHTHTYTHARTHTYTKQFHAGHLPLASQIFSTLLCALCPVRAVVTGSPTAGSGKRLKTGEFRCSLSWLPLCLHLFGDCDWYSCCCSLR